MSARRSVSGLFVLLCVIGGCVLFSSAPALAQREHAFSSSFGSEGSGPGELMQPGAMAVNEATGDVYVIDLGNNRVDIFGSNGAYVSEFNGSGAPTGPLSWTNEATLNEGYGSINGVGFNGGLGDGGIAVDNSTNPADPSKGDVYVVDWKDGVSNAVVDKFTAGGVYLGQIAGRSATSPYERGHRPGAIAVAPNGELWMLLGLQKASLPIDRFNDASSNE
jgi:DNA-binding beta-propeller fold protein YncE